MTSASRRPAALVRALLVLALAAPAARANPFELYGFTPRGLAMGGTMVAMGDDLGAAFYNPAGLLGHSKTEFGLGFTYTRSMLYVDRLRPEQPDNRTAVVENSPRFELGLIFPLGGKLLRDRVVIGVGGGHPMGSLIRVQTLDQSRPQFYMYSSKPQRFALSTAVGVKIVDGLSVGVGAQVIAEQVGSVKFAVDAAARRFTAREITVDLNTVPTPLAGILVEPTDTLKLGFSWRQEAKLYYEQPTTIDLGDIGALKLDVAGIAQYWPHTFSLGGTYRFGGARGALLVSAQVDYLLWQRADRDQVSVKITPTGAVLDGLGLSDVLGFESADAQPGFSNILVPRIGAEFAATEYLTVRGGAWARPPVTPDQNGATNYLDNFTTGFGAGLSYRFVDPLQVFTDPVSFDLAGQLILANERENRKQVGDRTGSAVFGGALFSIGAMLRYLY